MNTFADLTQLRWLDLSDNHLSEVPHRAFYGLTLQHLFLNGNDDIRLLPDSFEGLVTSGLYLHDCALQVLPSETLSPLNGTLVNLWLNGNRLTSVDRRLDTVFSQLSHLRLGANPLHCGCEVVWLKQLYDRQGGATFRGAEPPTCWTPARLRDKHFDQLTPADLHCTAPSFGNINAVLDWSGTGRLLCTATGQPTPTIYWITPSGKTRRFDARTPQTNRKSDSTVGRIGHNKGELSISNFEAQSGLYICVAKNQVGNVTLTVNVSWPESSRSSSQRASLSDSHKLSVQLPATLEPPRDDVRYDATQVTDAVRLFTVSELVAAVVITHLCTVLIVCVILLSIHLVCTKRHHQSTQHADRRVCDSLLNKPTLKSTRKSTTPYGLRWPARVT